MQIWKLMGKAIPCKQCFRWYAQFLLYIVLKKWSCEKQGRGHVVHHCYSTKVDSIHNENFYLQAKTISSRILVFADSSIKERNAVKVDMWHFHERLFLQNTSGCCFCTNWISYPKQCFNIDGRTINQFIFQNVPWFENWKKCPLQ